MSKKPISPLRQRMIDDMTARRVKEKVQKDYVRHVRTFAAFLGRSPDTATSEGVRRFQVHLARQEIGVATINAAIAALRFFFNVTLERPDLVVARPQEVAEPGREVLRKLVSYLHPRGLFDPDERRDSHLALHREASVLECPLRLKTRAEGCVCGPDASVTCRTWRVGFAYERAHSLGTNGTSPL